MKIAILGGGISGCALARMLAADGHNVTVLEKTERPGGLCKSRKYGEFTFDEAGGHILFSKDKEVLQWQLDRCGGEAEKAALPDLCWAKQPEIDGDLDQLCEQESVQPWLHIGRLST